MVAIGPSPGAYMGDLLHIAIFLTEAASAKQLHHAAVRFAAKVGKRGFTVSAKMI